MPPKPRARGPKTPSTTHSCQHDDLLIEPSAHAAMVGYTQPSADQRAKAQGSKPQGFDDRPSTFPAPLVLPDDDLALDPKQPPQSVLAWTRLKERNPVTPRRRTIYLVPPPASTSQVSFVSSWTKPDDVDGAPSVPAADYPKIEHVAAYIRAFYHPLPVTVLPASTFTFTSWSVKDTALLAKSSSSSSSSSSSASASAALIGLKSPTEIIGIRTRNTRAQSPGFARQLHLDDLLDGAIATLPADAFAMVMLVDHDLYEHEDDEFVCGRAYGGSRVAVVSTARYNPLLDPGTGLDLQHVWPASHCRVFVDGMMGQDGGSTRKRPITAKSKVITGDVHMLDADEELSSSSKNKTHAESALHAAVDAVKAFRTQPSSITSTSNPNSYSFLTRLCRTVSHELGHCFGIDHCTYYACVMQGSASLLEDARQPLYPCPVDVIKVLKATGASEQEWMAAMLEFCESFACDDTFVGLGAWIKSRKGNGTGV